MNLNIYDDLLSRKRFIEERLANLPAHAKMSKLSLDQQLVDINEKIQNLESIKAPQKARTTLTFSGDPVDGSRGILPDFTAKAISAFSDVIDSLIGRDNIESAGKLYITNTAIGSFGFVLEESDSSYSSDGQANLNLDSDETLTKKAIDSIMLFFRNADTEDEVLSERLGDMDDSSLDKIRKFINVLNTNNALCSIKTKDSKFSFSDPDQVLRIKEILTEDNIKKKDKSLDGMFVGILPYSRTGEFKERHSGEVIKVKIPKKIELPSDTAPLLNREITIQVKETSFKDRKPSYSLDDNEVLV